MEAEMAAEIEEALRNYVPRSPRQYDDDREDSAAARRAKAHYEIEADIRKKYKNKRIFEDSDMPEPKRAKALVDGILHLNDWAIKIWDGLTLEEKQYYLGLDEPRKTGVDYLDRTARVLLSSIETNKPGASSGGGRSRKPRYNTYRKKKRKITKRRRYKKTLRR